MKRLEIERRFLVGSLPADLLKYRSVMILQFYTRATPKSPVVRYRQEGQKLYKQSKSGSGLVRGETRPKKVSAKEFVSAWRKLIGQEVVKRRFSIRADKHVYYLDIFCCQLQGLFIVEVEFKTKAGAIKFTPPAWFGREVTDDKPYANFSLARFGRPKED